MIWLYRILFVPIFLAMLPAYLRRMRKRGGYGENFGHRFGGLTAPARTGRKRVWIQAVSVGEMLAIAPILQALQRRSVEVFLTTTTSTGYELAKQRYAGMAAGIGYFPLDWAPFSAKAWNRIRPDVAVLTEGERWPEHLRQAGKRRVPVICINARLSDRSYRRLRAFRPAARLVLAGITRLLPSSAQDERRFAELGFPRERMVATGNLKLDVQIAPLSAADQAALRAELALPADGRLLVGASTWAGEEAALIAALQAARTAGVACSLLIVPRHAERRDEIVQELEASGLKYHLRSRDKAMASPAHPVDVSIADTTGELQKLVQLADLVFVGKSLPPHTEGQTPVEAAALEKPILFGPGMANFRAITQELLAAGAAHQVATPDALSREVTELLQDPTRRSSLAKAATTWHAANRGAVNRTLEVIVAELQ